MKEENALFVCLSLGSKIRRFQEMAVLRCELHMTPASGSLLIKKIVEI
jgi:hypothetical protein